jgi:hypothetical protein
LPKAYYNDLKRKHLILEKANSLQRRLDLIACTARKLFEDEKFRKLLETENLNLIPKALWLRIAKSRESKNKCAENDDRTFPDAHLRLGKWNATLLNTLFGSVSSSYGIAHLELVVISGYLNKLLDNARILRHMAAVHSNKLAVLQKIADTQIADPAAPEQTGASCNFTVLC